jgi:hypothetical protein
MEQQAISVFQDHFSPGAPEAISAESIASYAKAFLKRYAAVRKLWGTARHVGLLDPEAGFDVTTQDATEPCDVLVAFNTDSANFATSVQSALSRLVSSWDHAQAAPLAYDNQAIKTVYVLEPADYELCEAIEEPPESLPFFGVLSNDEVENIMGYHLMGGATTSRAAARKAPRKSPRKSARRSPRGATRKPLRR